MRLRKKPLPRKVGLFERGARGGPRPNAGRKRTNPTFVRHRTRPEHHRNEPVHVTLRLVSGLPSLRHRRFNSIREAVEKAHHEVGTAGQAEINYKYNTLLHAADDLQLYKYIIKNTAWAAGRTVTFMPSGASTLAKLMTVTTSSEAIGSPSFPRAMPDLNLRS